jgi:hypothetical protein
MPMKLVEWPHKLTPVVKDAEVVLGPDGKGYCRIDVDVDAETLMLLNEVEAHARHRQVQIRMTDGSRCIRGEMNTLIGLGNASNPAKSSKVRISFHNVTTAECSDDTG